MPPTAGTITPDDLQEELDNITPALLCIHFISFNDPPCLRAIRSQNFLSSAFI